MITSVSHRRTRSDDVSGHAIKDQFSLAGAAAVLAGALRPSQSAEHAIPPPTEEAEQLLGGSATGRGHARTSSVLSKASSDFRTDGRKLSAHELDFFGNPRHSTPNALFPLSKSSHVLARPRPFALRIASGSAEVDPTAAVDVATAPPPLSPVYTAGAKQQPNDDLAAGRTAFEPLTVSRREPVHAFLDTCLGDSFSNIFSGCLDCSLRRLRLVVMPAPDHLRSLSEAARS